jgi:cytochrome c
MNKLIGMGLAAGCMFAAQAAISEDAMAIATANGCMACHQVENKVVGPSYKEVAAKYKDQEGAKEMLIGKVRAGGVGTFGQIPMPPQAAISDENLAAVVDWILTL